MASPLQVLIFIFPKMDTLDFAIPLECFSMPNRILTPPHQQAGSPPLLHLTIASATPLTTTSQNASIQRHVSIQEAIANISTYDILVAPGGRREVVTTLATPGHEEYDLVTAFITQLPRPDDSVERLVLSICTGAFFLAGAGALVSKKATTSHLALEALAAFCKPLGETEVLESRFVDAGLVENNRMRVVTSGGISSGLDACLWVLEGRFGREVAEKVAVILEYAWRREEGVVV